MTCCVLRASSGYKRLIFAFDLLSSLLVTFRYATDKGTSVSPVGYNSAVLPAIFERAQGSHLASNLTQRGTYSAYPTEQENRPTRIYINRNKPSTPKSLNSINMGSTWSSNRPPLNKLRLYSETVELFNITKLSRLGKSRIYPMYAKAEVATETTICVDLSRHCAMNIRRQVSEARKLHESCKTCSIL